MLKRHPTVQIPDIGPMDHAWDLLGEWQAEFELPESESPVHGKVTFRSWGDAELLLDPIGGDRRDSVQRAARARQRGPSDRCRRRGAPVGAARTLDQLVAPGHHVAGVAAPVRARSGGR